MTEIEKLKQTLHQICTEIENQSIENDVYYEAILDSRSINLPDLKQRVDAAIADPERRKTAQQRYAEMRLAISDAALNAAFSDLLANLPENQKPN